MSVQLPPNSTGSVVDTSTIGGKERQNVSIGDPTVAAAIQAVTQLHAGDNQPQSIGYASLTTGVALLQNPLGNTDRQRSLSVDNVPSLGIAAGGANFLMQALSTDSADNFAPGTRTFTPAAMSGLLAGAAWSIQVGSMLILDVGANQESVYVTAVTGTTFTCVTTKTHNGTVTPFQILVNTYNQERDAAGELDGANGTGTALAAGFEYNGGGPQTNAVGNPPSNLQYDRERSLQGKNLQGGTISNNPLAAGATSLTLTAAIPQLLAGQQILLDRAGANPESAYVAKNFVTGSTTVPLQSATQFLHALASTVEVDVFGPLGPQLNGFTAVGMGIEEEALFNPIDGKYYIERSATQDAMPAANIVAENPALWNGAAMDRARSGSAANLAAKSAVGSELTSPPGQWSVLSTPAAATQATASQTAGGAGVRNVCNTISATLATAGTAQAAAAVLNLRDGATGAGTILWSLQVILPTNGLWSFSVGGLNIPGTAATAMTLEFAAAGVAASFQSVAMSGTTSA
jgi:hypothetical protein